VAAGTYSAWEAKHPVPTYGPDVTYASTRMVLDSNYPAGDLEHDLADQTKQMVGFHLRGQCPRCFDPTSAVCSTRYLAQELSPSEGGRDRYQYTTLKCACIQVHAGATGGAFGCGAEWMLKISYDSENPGRSPLIENVTKEEAQYRWAPADANGAAIPASLSSFQATASKWQTALTAFVALVGVGSLLSGRTNFQALSGGWQLCLAIALGVAVLSDALMLYSGDLASLGLPTLNSEARDVKDLKNADLAPLKEARKAEHQLWCAIGFAVPTVIASVCALAILLFVEPVPTYKVSYTEGTTTMTTSCGTFSSVLPPAGQPLPPGLTFTAKVNGATPLRVSALHITTIAGC
jgi:hypothetical protein